MGATVCASHFFLLLFSRFVARYVFALVMSLSLFIWCGRNRVVKVKELFETEKMAGTAFGWGERGAAGSARKCPGGGLREDKCQSPHYGTGSLFAGGPAIETNGGFSLLAFSAEPASSRTS